MKLLSCITGLSLLSITAERVLWKRLIFNVNQWDHTPSARWACRAGRRFYLQGDWHAKPRLAGTAFPCRVCGTTCSGEATAPLSVKVPVEKPKPKKPLEASLCVDLVFCQISPWLQFGDDQSFYAWTVNVMSYLLDLTSSHVSFTVGLLICVNFVISGAFSIQFSPCQNMRVQLLIFLWYFFLLLDYRCGTISSQLGGALLQSPDLQMHLFF